MSRSTRSRTLKWREGDGPFIHFHAQTTDRLALFAVERPGLHARPATSCPAARGFGEPVRLLIDLDAEVDIVQLMVVRPETKLLVASSATARASSPAAKRRSPRRARASSWSICGPARKVAVVRAIPDGADAVAVVGENRKMLVFPLAELPELARGQGVTLQRYRDGGLSDAIAFQLADGLSWALGGESGRVRTESDLTPWRAARGAAGRMPPIGFPRSNRFD